MKKNILTLIAVTAILFSACKKDNNKPPVDELSPYQPFTANSTWQYRSEYYLPGAAADVDTSVNTMTAVTKDFNGKTFHLVKSVSGGETDSVYFSVNNHIYTTRADDAAIPEINYLDDAKAAGDSWITPLVIDSVSAQVKTTIVEKNATKTIAGKTYNNVIRSKNEIQTKVGGVFKTNTIIEIYAAKGIGVVAIYSSYDNKPLLKSELISYSIK